MSALKGFIQKTGLENFDFDDGKVKTEVIAGDIDSTLSEVKADLTSADIEMTKVNDAAQALSEESAALEAYCDLLRRASQGQGITPRGFQALSIGVEAFESRSGYRVANFPAVRDVGGRLTQRQAATVSLESLSEAAKATWEAFKAAMAALIGQIQDYATKLLDGSKKLEVRGQALATAVAALNGTPKTPTFDIANASPLAVDGQFGGQDHKPVTNMVAQVYAHFLGGLTFYIEDITKTIDKVRFDAPLSEVDLKGALTHAPHTWFSFGSVPVEGDSRFPAGTKVMRSPTMAGNMAIYLATPEKDAAASSAELAEMLKTCKFSLLPVTDAKPLTEVSGVAVDNAQNLKARVTQINLAIKQIVDKQEYATDAKAALDKLLHSVDQLQQRAAAAKDASAPAAGTDANATPAAPASGENPTQVVQDFVAVANNLKSMMGKDVQGMLAYSVRTLGAYLSVIDKEVACYSEPAAAPAEAAPAAPAPAPAA
jgi:hypothetical protein